GMNPAVLNEQVGLIIVHSSDNASVLDQDSGHRLPLAYAVSELCHACATLYPSFRCRCKPACRTHVAGHRREPRVFSGMQRRLTRVRSTERSSEEPRNALDPYGTGPLNDLHGCRTGAAAPPE